MSQVLFYVCFGSRMFSEKLVAGICLAGLLATWNPPARAEVDGEELLLMMNDEKGREAAQFFIDDVWQRWNNKVFCMPEGNFQEMSFGAVKSYLDSHPEELYRPRRYLIVQGLRGAFPCGTEDKAK